MMVFDLDPGPPANIVQCCEVGLWLRGIFEKLGLQCFAKTSGSKGLQLYVPLNTPVTYDETKEFSHTMARLLESEHPDKVISLMKKALRTNKIFVDYLRNTRGATAVAPYSTRALPTATVSVPLHWDELDPKKDLRSRFTVSTVPARMESIDDPWADFAAAAAPITSEAVDAIGSITLRAKTRAASARRSSRRRATR
jgi:bifunctional non-homologous end joining protein LigD